ncbi:hypothetical protein [Lyngbya confervoides]|uniref:Uncharacterized protein n=1 Tax=Lyngbya confervoides BDU141951 TaxID=1574623 RepID=A0ABD4SYJ3_9CYAN|nr:hypothetical protein [Lyngbya confervoides]MCM1981511.1 hypothetical protein [Lyngbya confervoides BDU141951]
MFHVFAGHPELGVSVAYNLEPVQHIALYSDYCSIDLPEKPTVTFQATVIDTFPLDQVESLIRQFTFRTGDRLYRATLGILS